MDETPVRLCDGSLDETGPPSGSRGLAGSSLQLSGLAPSHAIALQLQTGLGPEGRRFPGTAATSPSTTLRPEGALSLDFASSLKTEGTWPGPLHSVHKVS